MFGALEHAGVDARRRKIVWSDGKRLSIEALDGPHPHGASGRASPPDRNSRAGLARKLCARIPTPNANLRNSLTGSSGPWLDDYERTSRAAPKR